MPPLSNVDSQMADIEKMLAELDEVSMDVLNDEFDPENSLCPTHARKREEDKRRMYAKTDMVKKLGKNMNDRIAHKLKVEPIVIKELAQAEEDQRLAKAQKELKEVEFALSKDEEALFHEVSEQELIEFAALSDLHGMLTQAQSNAVLNGNKPEIHGILTEKPLKGPRRCHLHLDDEDIDLDVPLLMECLENDTEDIFYVRIQNIHLEKYVLYGIFEKLKSTTKMKHLTLTNVGITDEKLLTLLEVLRQNKTIETLNIESNHITSHSCEPFMEMLAEHPSIREIKIAHQKFGLGARGEHAMAEMVEKNKNILKVGYSFEVRCHRSKCDRCVVKNQDAERAKRARGEPYYNYPEEARKRNAWPQPWIRKQEARTDKMKKKINMQKVRMKSIPNIAQMRAMARAKAKTDEKK